MKTDGIRVLMSARRAAALRRREFSRPLPRVERTRGAEPAARVERPSTHPWPMIPLRAVNGSRVPAAKVLEGPLEWLSQAARDVEEATDGRYMLLVEGTRVEMNATLAMEAGGEIILGF